MANRPFELDDLVISKNGTGIVTGLVANKRAVSCEFGENTSYYSLKTGKECQFSSAIDWDDGDEIKHIRTPRKGSKEARDIVAMLGRYQHKSLSSMLKVYTDLREKPETIEERTRLYWEIRKRGFFNEQSQTYLHFQRAKSMLK